ncbi:MAG TPA: phospho-N-acetylmuramoyl-pentapeptide-transferase [Candidatus Eisenbergiella merdigallinarum]|uniref:Phospho-N-acetylmuramoyl-pentapeptide-transferase n=1 Tax=Candidatus Eisenbergiella merdigallinarum TaxID=2838552 RepID=A0A9D2MRE1_9FIRM|nr:phospho-N-acetylmuramoyl-pentapeptide-transferase [Candidatus Eisenbergiella merdigallinarum]
MYSFLIRFFTPNQILMVGMLVIFGLTFFLLKHPFPFLPSDHGREFAVNGNLSKGKLRGVGLTFVLCFLAGCFLFLPVDREFAIYAILLFAMMLSGYLDDASDHPWNEYKKGLIDLIIAAVAVGTFLNFNSSVVGIGPWEVEIPKALFFALGVALFWVSVNVTNCTDGVDGLCASLCSVTLLAFSLLFSGILAEYAMANFLFIAVLFAYLYFNTSPSSMLMGDAGSRALGFYIAVVALKSGHPFLYLLLAGVMLADGGIGLVKVFLKRFLKISILKNTRTPLHDHVRKNCGWSDTQVVVRYVILQVLLAAAAFCLAG